MKKRLSLVILSVILCVSALCSVMFMTTASAAETSGTISFASTAQRTKQDGTIQIWENDGVKFTNNKASSTSSVGNYSNPVRLYANSSLIFEAPGNITKIEVTANSSSYATVLKNSVGSEATVSGSKVTIVPTKSSTSYTVAKLTAQTRFSSLTVYYTPSCDHSSTEYDNIKAPTCIADGSQDKICTACGTVVTTETIPATGHNYGDAVETKAPSCTDEGISTQTCSVCSDVLESSIPALGHKYEGGSCTECGERDPEACSHSNLETIVVPATKTENGSETIICGDCGEVQNTKVLEALGCEVSFVVPDGATAPENQSGVLTVTLPDAVVAPSVYNKYNYEFAGWAIMKADGSVDMSDIFAAGETFIPTDDIIFCAIYSYVDETVQTGYEKVDDITKVESGKTVVITVVKGGKVYAMSNDKGSSNPPIPVELTVSGNKISGDVASNITWYFENSDGNLSFYVDSSKAKWLYCTNNNNGLRVGTNTDKTFIIENNYLKHVGQGRFIGVYNTQDWRSYTSINSNIQNQTYGFYVLSGPETVYTAVLESANCEHTYESQVTKAATCTELGVMTHTCSKCGDSYTSDIPLADHHYVEEILNPTCNAYGTITNTCSG